MGKIKFTNLKLLDIFQPNISKKKNLWGCLDVVFYNLFFFCSREQKK